MQIFKDIAYGEFERNKLDLYLPDEGSFSVFVYFHGGGIEKGDKSGYPTLAETKTISLLFPQTTACIPQRIIRTLSATQQQLWRGQRITSEITEPAIRFFI